MERTIFTDLLYEDTIDVTKFAEAEIFVKANLDPSKVTIPNLLWVAEEIANTYSLVDGLNFMTLAVGMASYELNTKTKKGLKWQNI